MKSVKNSDIENSKNNYSNSSSYVDIPSLQGMTEEEAVLLWPNIEEFVKEFGARPSIMSNDPYEKRLAEALAFIQKKKAERLAAQQQ